MTLKLVKDFQDYQFVYFWIDGDKQVVSPLLPTLEHAREWFTDRHFENYEGQERRRRKVDRRNIHAMDKNDNAEVPFSRRVPSKTGRRASDHKISIDIDLSKEKISKLKQA